MQRVVIEGVRFLNEFLKCLPVREILGLALCQELPQFVAPGRFQNGNAQPIQAFAHGACGAFGRANVAAEGLLLPVGEQFERRPDIQGRKEYDCAIQRMLR